jgi:hypothetical protein
MSVYGNAYQWGGYPWGPGMIPKQGGRAWFVDGTNGLDGNSGKSPKNAFASIKQAVETNPDVQEFDTIYVFPKTMLVTSTDPLNYAETVTISTPHLNLVGVGAGPVQGGLPQMKIGAGTTAMITVAAPGVTIRNMGLNGGDSTGGGISISAISQGLVIEGCHFKNCKCHATSGIYGGAIYWPTGGGWQTLIKGNRFYKNLADIVVVTTGSSRPQDIVIEDNIFSGPAASVDVNIYGMGLLDGVDGLIINRNVFTALPAIGTGAVGRFFELTGCVGIVSNNVFGCTGITFGAAGDTGGNVPTTMLMVNNHQETAIADDNYQGTTINRTA